MIQVQYKEKNNNNWARNKDEIKRLIVTGYHMNPDKTISNYITDREYYRLVVNGELKYAKGLIKFDSWTYRPLDGKKEEIPLRKKNKPDSNLSLSQQYIPESNWDSDHYTEVYVFFEDGYYIKEYKKTTHYGENGTHWSYWSSKFNNDNEPEYQKIAELNQPIGLGKTAFNNTAPEDTRAMKFEGWYYHPGRGAEPVKVNTIKDLYKIKEVSLFRYKDSNWTVPNITLYAHWTLKTYKVRVKNITIQGQQSSFKYHCNQGKVKTAKTKDAVIVLENVKYNTNLQDIFYNQIDGKPTFNYPNLKYLNKDQRDRINAKKGYFRGWSTKEIASSTDIVLYGYVGNKRGGYEGNESLEREAVFVGDGETTIFYFEKFIDVRQIKSVIRTYQGQQYQISKSNYSHGFYTNEKKSYIYFTSPPQKGATISVTYDVWDDTTFPLYIKNNDIILYPQFEALIIYPSYSWKCYRFYHEYTSYFDGYSEYSDWSYKKGEKRFQRWKSNFQLCIYSDHIKAEISQDNTESEWDWTYYCPFYTNDINAARVDVYEECPSWEMPNKEWIEKQKYPLSYTYVFQAKQHPDGLETIKDGSWHEHDIVEYKGIANTLKRIPYPPIKSEVKIEKSMTKKDYDEIIGHFN